MLINETINVCTYYSNVELPFDWIIVKPYIKPKDPESKDSPIPPTERVQDIETVFSIEPESSVLAPSTTTTFTLTFAPPHVRSNSASFVVAVIVIVVKN